MQRVKTEGKDLIRCRQKGEEANLNVNFFHVQYRNLAKYGMACPSLHLTTTVRKAR